MKPTFHPLETDNPDWEKKWRGLRCGRITASEYKCLFMEGRKAGSVSETRLGVLYRVVAEIITEEPIESYTNAYMDRGKEQEAEARAMYGMATGFKIARMGFVSYGRTGCSPDALVEKDRVLEIKTERADILARTIDTNEFPMKHYAQCQGALYCNPDRAYCDLAIYAPKMPLFLKTVKRDPRWIAQLEAAIKKFYVEADALVAKVKAYR